MRLPLIEQAAKAARNEQEPPGQEYPLCRDRVRRVSGLYRQADVSWVEG
jgi:hypothetical protein